MLLAALLCAIAPASTASPLASGRQVTDEELGERLVSGLTTSSREARRYREGELLEVVRRGGEDWAQRLERAYDEVKRIAKADGFSDESLELHVLTALRRLQGRPDPLTVEAKLLTEGPYVFPDLPVIGVRLLHTEGETETFLSRIGGDYRGGRLGRFDLVLQGPDGTPHFGIDDHSAFMGGGISRRKRVGPGFIWGVPAISDFERMRLKRRGEPVPEDEDRPVPLAMMSYVRPRAMGKFTVRAAYHATEAIADLDGYGDRIVHLSAPLAFEWQRRVIELTEPEEIAVRALVNNYLKSKSVAVTHYHLPKYQGAGDKSAHPLDRLFDCGWKAVPFMIDALVMQATPHERALLIAGLHSLTGMESPAMGRGALGSYTTHGTRVPPGSGVFSTPATGKTGGKIRPGAQRVFMDGWAAHRKFIEVRRIEKH